MQTDYVGITCLLNGTLSRTLVVGPATIIAVKAQYGCGLRFIGNPLGIKGQILAKGGFCKGCCASRVEIPTIHFVVGHLENGEGDFFANDTGNGLGNLGAGVYVSVEEIDRSYKVLLANAANTGVVDFMLDGFTLGCITCGASFGSCTGCIHPSVTESIGNLLCYGCTVAFGAMRTFCKTGCGTGSGNGCINNSVVTESRCEFCITYGTGLGSGTGCRCACDVILYRDDCFGFSLAFTTTVAVRATCYAVFGAGCINVRDRTVGVVTEFFKNGFGFCLAFITTVAVCAACYAVFGAGCINVIDRTVGVVTEFFENSFGFCLAFTTAVAVRAA